MHVARTTPVSRPAERLCSRHWTRPPPPPRLPGKVLWSDGSSTTGGRQTAFLPRESDQSSSTSSSRPFHRSTCFNDIQVGAGDILGPNSSTPSRRSASRRDPAVPRVHRSSCLPDRIEHCSAPIRTLLQSGTLRKTEDSDDDPARQWLRRLFRQTPTPLCRAATYESNMERGGASLPVIPPAGSAHGSTGLIPSSKH